MSAPLLSAAGLRFAYDGRPVLDGVTLHARAGEFVGVVGPNGAGKSTLLRLLVGILRAQAGEVRLGDEPLEGLSRREIARRAAFLPQEGWSGFAFTVEQTVAMGRTPHLSRFRPEGARDREVVRRAMERTACRSMAARRMSELSGGERQRVLLGRCLAQEAPLLVLDEPSANLDLLHAFQLLDLVRHEVDGGCAAVAALHDLNLAARCCDRLVVLHLGGVRSEGRPAEVLGEALLEEVFGVRARLTELEGRIQVSVLGPA